ncbi:MAG: sugar ABC transporter substrate-binding protein [Chloroflexi bacterium]|nr:sugar ABC transporter substrate-binding protein [Chloroflexota bacterium]MCY4246317.1 sugar ABC transporter substrate-binding protein [Chloroflexota bacterium]
MDKQQLSRRAFLKLAAASSSGIALAGVGPLRNIAAAQDTVELTFGRHWEAAFRPRQAEYDEGFMERHPDIKISITYNTWTDHNNVVPAWAAAGTLPDIVYVHGSRATPWAHEGIIIDIHDLAVADDEFNVDGMWEESLRLYRVNGRIHALPYDHGPIILGYNADMFDAAGLDYPDENWTMEDMASAAAALTDANMGVYGWDGNFSLGNSANGFFLGAWGATNMNDDETAMTMDTPEAREALSHWYNLIHEEGVAPTAAEAEAFPNQNVFRAGAAAMGHLATWDTPSMRAQASFNWDVAPAPMGADGTRATTSFGSGYGITPTSDKPDAAWRYLREYLSVDGMIFMWSLSGRGSPARPEGLEAWLTSDPAPPNGQYFLEAMFEYATTGHPYSSLASAQVSQILDRESNLLKLGEASVDQVIATIMEEGNAALDAVADDM